MKKNFNSLVWGIAFIAAGILVALNIAGIIDFNIWANLWPIIFVLIGLSIIGDNKKNIIGYIFIALGIIWILKNSFDLPFDSKYAFSVILILVGIVIIFNIFNNKQPVNNQQESLKVNFSQFTAFSGRADRIACNEYYGTNTFCIFGGHEIDLRDYIFHNDVKINATAIFGGIELILPENVNVVISSFPLFGGVENKCTNSGNNPYTVYLHATAVFGGVELKNRK